MNTERLLRLFTKIKDAEEIQLPDSAPAGLKLGFEKLKEEFIIAQIGLLQEECRKIHTEYETKKISSKA